MSIDNVKAYFSQLGRADSVMEFPVSSATVAEAARAVNCDEARIAKTLSLKLNDKAILIVVAGDKKIDNHKYKQFFGKKAAMLKADEVENLTGHPIGGVCPFAVKEGIKTYLDESLKRFSTVFPACGSSNSAIELTTAELEKYSHAVGWIDISKTSDH
ncbi:YbaK/EbsC family protein [Pectinatus haikarae]|uniref:Prolyl-tRNA editing enzyme YbaK/EbsC (Cys-tRNA(Pro) deacylase) n=1 Tax=Pectinatus haikarae TaxID=349096 RepID=A0ABT9YAZ6_9FIRM|nr:YbaK/EbsC family protein [Pectinatus haikarae]MDQ0204823.1 prolyl-tRNA editing enzyme YbaK/EbsC (Cys-tRNA(Pro) deacylase) [Pectinatus haikarae]